MLPKEELDAIKERCENATEGYWHANYEEWPGNENLQYWVDYLDEKDRIDGLCATVRKEDAEFIANAKEDIPKLLSEIDELRNRLDDVEGLLEDALGDLDEVYLNLYNTNTYDDITDYFAENEPITRRDGE